MGIARNDQGDRAMAKQLMMMDSDYLVRNYSVNFTIVFLCFSSHLHSSFSSFLSSKENTAAALSDFFSSIILLHSSSFFYAAFVLIMRSSSILLLLLILLLLTLRLSFSRSLSHHINLPIII